MAASYSARISEILSVCLRISEILSVYCMGDWDAVGVAEHASAVRLLRT
jgi:hypothetical protein